MKHLLLFIFISAGLYPAFASGKHHLKDTSGHYTSFDGVKIYYEVKGLGPAVVLVHGFIVNGESWKKTALYTDLITKGYQVITMDLRGNGKSDKPHDSTAYANDAEAKDIMGLLSSLGIKKYAAVGYSRGSIITARLMALDNRLSSAVMGGMGLDFTNPEWPRRKMFYRALSGEAVPELDGAVKYVKENHLDQQALAYLQLYQPSTPVARLSQFKKPVLVISGDKDTDNGSARELAAVFPNATFAEVPGVHNTANQSPEFSKEVLRFLSK